MRANADKRCATLRCGAASQTATARGEVA
ncbi:DUF6380 family protein [Streptomyces sp. NPDC019443]